MLTIGRRFGTAIGFDNPARMGPDKLLVLYRGVIERAAESSLKSPARLQKTVAWALREYQRHIVCKFKANAVQESVAFRVEQGILPVNARVLSLDDMFRIIDYIKTAPHAHWLPKYREYAIAESVLAFFGGTRREEGLGLTASDYFPSLVRLLLIRDNEIRTLKTLNAKRALYLSTAAYPFTDLVEHVARFFRQVQKPDEPVFADVSDDLIIRIIHDAILKVTGDANCTLHSLRHSFGHWMFFRLALAQLNSSEEELFPHLNETKRWLRESGTYRELLYSNGLVENDHAWATADELGHSVPEKVTIPHYVHCQDILLSLALKKDPVFGPETVRQLWAAEKHQKKKAAGEKNLGAKISEPTIYSATRSTNIQDPRIGTDWLSGRKTTPREEFRKRFGLKRLEPGNIEPSRKPFEWLDATENALYLAGVLNMPLSAVGKSTGLNEETVQQILLRLKEASQMKSPKDYTILHAIAQFRGSPAVIGDSAVGCHPLRPRSSEDGVKWASIFAGKLRRYVESDDEQARTTIGYIVRNMLPDRPCVVFLDPESQMVSKYLNLCRWLGILREQIAGFSSDGSRNTSPTGNWLSHWGLSSRWKSQIVNQHGRGRLLRKPDEWLILEPTSLERDQPSGHDPRKWLRYALLMAYIRFGPLIET